MMHAQQMFSGIFTGYDEHDVFKLLVSRLICYTLSIFVHYFGAKHYNFGKGYFCKTTSTLSDGTDICMFIPLSWLENLPSCANKRQTPDK